MKQCLSLLLCPPGSPLVAVVPPLLTSSYSSTQNVPFLPAPHTALLVLFPCQTYSKSRLICACLRLQLVSNSCSTSRSRMHPLSPTAQKVPFDFS